MSFKKRIEEAYKAFIDADKKDLQLKDRDFATQFTICTNCCTWLQENFFPDSVIMGYFLEDNPTANAAKDCGGHDFLLVEGKWVVDFWVRYIDQRESAPLYLHLFRQKSLVKFWYGNPHSWETLDKVTLKDLNIIYGTNTTSAGKV